jgi:hypothetical protein
MRVRRVGTRPNSIRLDHIAVSAGPTRAQGFAAARGAFSFSQAGCAARSFGGLVRIAKEPAFAADTVLAAPMTDAANTSRLGNMVASLQR